MTGTIAVDSMWEELWDKNQTGWQGTHPNENLEKLFLDLVPSDQSTEGKTVFVPLCGKTLDMRWLYDKGFTVIGVEAVEKAVLEFFEEQKLEYKVEKVGAFDVYTSKNEKIKIFQGNLFDFSEDLVGKFDHFWDRGSLVAIDKNTREQYRELFTSVMKPGSNGLLEVFEYDSKLNSDQPFPLFITDLKNVFLSSFELEELSRNNDFKGLPFGPTTVVAYKVSLK